MTARFVEQRTVDPADLDPYPGNPNVGDVKDHARRAARHRTYARCMCETRTVRPVISPDTHCPYGHPRTPENTYHRPDSGSRICRPCSARREKKQPAPPRITYTHCVNGHDLAEVGTLPSRPNTCRRCHTDTLRRATAARHRRTAIERGAAAQRAEARERDADGRWLYCTRGLHRLDDPANIRWQKSERTCGPCWRQARRERRARIRAQVIALYGGACRCCGETWPPFLHLDHVASDGASHRRTIRRDLSGWALANDCPASLQLLCANCNLSKEHEGCPATHAGRVAAGTAHDDRLETVSP